MFVCLYFCHFLKFVFVFKFSRDDSCLCFVFLSACLQICFRVCVWVGGWHDSMAHRHHSSPCVPLTPLIPPPLSASRPRGPIDASQSWKVGNWKLLAFLHCSALCIFKHCVFWQCWRHLLYFKSKSPQSPDSATTNHFPPKSTARWRNLYSQF